MYTEVKELVNFLCRYIHGRTPRRATGLFGAELGNFLVSQFSATWDPKNPLNGESDRQLVVNCPEGTSQCFELAAIESGLDVHEILFYLPLNLRIWTSPGKVFFRCNEPNAIAVPIFMGDVNRDEMYQPVPEYYVKTAAVMAGRHVNSSNLGAAGQPYMPARKPFPCMDRAVMELINGINTPLALEESDEINSNLCHLQEMFPYRFVYKPPSSQSYTGYEFSQTRFGSTKPRPDLQTMMNIKLMVAAAEAEAGSDDVPSPSTMEQNFFNYCAI